MMTMMMMIMIMKCFSSPPGYNLPLEYTKLVADCSRHDDDEDDNQKVWICKPVSQSQGRGIFLFKVFFHP